VQRSEKILLASASPRRADLLRTAGVTFEVVPADIDETPEPREEPEELVRRLSQLKALAVAKDHPDKIVLAADTVVEHDGELLGKPESEKHACEILSTLSGDSHEVMTGFSLIFPDGNVHTEVAVTEVEFRDLSKAEINAYIDSGDPMDKAGAYGIQSGAAGFVKSIAGSYTNVVGLPLAEVMGAIRNVGTPACDHDQREGNRNVGTPACDRNRRERIT